MRQRLLRQDQGSRRYCRVRRSEAGQPRRAGAHRAHARRRRPLPRRSLWHGLGPRSFIHQSVQSSAARAARRQDVSRGIRGPWPSRTLVRCHSPSSATWRRREHCRCIPGPENRAQPRRQAGRNPLLCRQVEGAISPLGHSRIGRVCENAEQGSIGDQRAEQLQSFRLALSLPNHGAGRAAPPFNCCFFSPSISSRHRKRFG